MGRTLKLIGLQPLTRHLAGRSIEKVPATHWIQCGICRTNAAHIGDTH